MNNATTILLVFLVFVCLPTWAVYKSFKKSANRVTRARTASTQVRSHPVVFRSESIPPENRMHVMHNRCHSPRCKGEVRKRHDGICTVCNEPENVRSRVRSRK